MKFTDDHIYQAPLNMLERMYFDTAFCPRKYRELGLQDIVVISSSDDPVDFHVACSFKMQPSITVPGFISKFLPGGELISVHQTDRWNTQTRKGRLDFVLEGLKPVRIHCDMSLEEHPEGAVNRMNWTVECSVPLAGGKIASFLAKDVQSKSAHDLSISQRILNDYL